MLNSTSHCGYPDGLHVAGEPRIERSTGCRPRFSRPGNFPWCGNRLFEICLFGLLFAVALSLLGAARMAAGVTGETLRLSDYLPLVLGSNVLFNHFPSSPTTSGRLVFHTDSKEILMRSRMSLLLLGILLLGLIPVWASESPIPVSPGSPEGSQVEARCSTFSWVAIEGAMAHELVVYRVGEDELEGEPVLQQRIPGSASSWTPPLGSCMERGGMYAWSVRALGRSEVSEWSPLSLFEVAHGWSEAEFEEALAVVRRYLEQEGRGQAESGRAALRWVPDAPSASPSALQASRRIAAQIVAAGDPGIQVNGSPVVTVATILGAECQALGRRYLDRGDGTVLDCNTGLLWLKDASCSDLLGTDSQGQASWGAAQSAAMALANGTCGLTDGSSAGDWRQASISEFCSAWVGSNLIPCPAGAAASSLIDSLAVGSPKVVSGTGQVTWSEGDVFDGVQSTGYWSSDQVDGFNAWSANLLNGNVTAAEDGFRFVWPVRDSP